VSLFKLKSLKKIRVTVSLVFFVSVSLLFIDPWNIVPLQVCNFLVSLQLIPSLTKVLVYSGLTTLGLVFVVGLTIAFGRVYCSTICPLGTFQDFIIHLEKKIHRKKRFEYKKAPFFFHYTVLIISGALAIFGSMVLLNLLEPFSNYGRVLTNLIEPLVIWTNNGLSYLLGQLNVYSLYNIPMRNVVISVLIVPVLFLALVAHMSYWHGRLFCNSLCPAGALLGLVSRFSILKIVIDEQSCNECGACERTCKANCIESDQKRIDFAACVGCFNCIKSCPTNGIVYSAPLKKKKSEVKLTTDASRRTFFKEIVTPAFGLLIPGAISKDSAAGGKSGYEESRKYPVSPPGSKSIEHFSSLCTACHLCVTACPTQVLYPSFLDYGVAGIFQPKMNYDASYCNYDCVICSQVCPSGAILPADTATKKLIQIGKANFFKDECVIVANKKDCAACSEHCPTKAVYTVPYQGKLKIPELNNDLCVGCGACEHACPTTPRKAIYVKANPVHLQAKKPEVKKKKEFDVKQDFPF
jgi:ferredoxin